MKIELFFKSSAQLTGILDLITERPLIFRSHPAFNIPNKMRDENLLPYAQQILERIPNGDVCVHYSLKNNKAKSVSEATDKFANYVASCHELGVKEVLLVSGSSGGSQVKRKINTVSCLQYMRGMSYSLPPSFQLGAAFNPYYTCDSSNELERSRLVEKLLTGYISVLYLQFGSNPTMLEQNLEFVNSVVDREKVRVFGSVFLPSKQLIARMKFRPWKGLLLSDEFLSGVAPAEGIVRDMLRIYRAYNVTPIIETAFRTHSEAQYLEQLLELQSVDANTASVPIQCFNRQEEEEGGDVDVEGKEGCDDEDSHGKRRFTEI